MNKKHSKLIICNLLFALVIICLYSPGILALSPFSPSAAKAALSIAIGAIALPVFIVMNKSLLSEKQLDLLDKNEKNPEEKITQVMEACLHSKVLGGIAKSALGQMRQLKTLETNFERIVGQRFERGSLSYQKFITAMDSASKALFQGYLKISNKLLIFNEREYRTLSSDEYLHDDIPDDIQRQKLLLYNENLDGARRILEDNEGILLGLERLMTEIANSDYSDREVDSAAREIDELLKQLEHYKTKYTDYH